MNENTLVMPDAPARNQRVVLQHTQGPYPGLFQIMGHSDAFGGQAPPITTEEFDISPGPRKGIAGLVKATPRYVLYREVNASLPPRR